MGSLSRRYPVPANNRKRVGVAAAITGREREQQLVLTAGGRAPANGGAQGRA